MKSHPAFILSTVLASAVLTFSGCASGNAYRVKVDALAKPAPEPVQSYVLKSKDPSLGDENLRYREAAKFVRTALSGKGLYEAPEAENADIVVELDYGMEAPRTKIERSSTPIYANFGGGVRYHSVPVTDSRGNTSFRTVQVYDPPRSELIGYDEVPLQTTIYEKYLKISARENKPAAEGRPPGELWTIQASAEDESNDLRKYLPIMASAAMEYIGEGTTSQEIVRVRADGPAVDFIRRGMNPPEPQPAAAPQG